MVCRRSLTLCLAALATALASCSAGPGGCPSSTCPSLSVDASAAVTLTSATFQHGSTKVGTGACLATAKAAAGPDSPGGTPRVGHLLVEVSCEAGAGAFQTTAVIDVGDPTALRGGDLPIVPRVHFDDGDTGPCQLSGDSTGSVATVSGDHGQAAAYPDVVTPDYDRTIELHVVSAGENVPDSCTEGYRLEAMVSIEVARRMFHADPEAGCACPL